MQRRITGFSHAAGEYIPRHPGQTAQEIVGYLLRSGTVQSAAENKEGSLVATLHKHHRQIGVERRWSDGRYRYYPKNGHLAPPPLTPTPGVNERLENGEITVMLRLPERIADVIDTLIASGACDNRPDGVNWLIEKGIAAIRINR